MAKRNKYDGFKQHVLKEAEQPGTYVFEPKVKFPCGFCGGELMAGTVGDTPTIVHEDPACNEFNTIESPVEFLAANRKKLGVPLPEEN